MTLAIDTSIKKSDDDTFIEKDKLYYASVLDWYFGKYLKDHTYVRYLFIVVIFFGIAAFLIYKTSMLNKEVERYPFPVYFKDEVNYFANIKDISSKDENINVSIAKYMVTQYLKKVEEFNLKSIKPEKLNKRLNFIKNLSSLKVFQKYFKFIDIDQNHDSPLLKYRYNNSRTIKIDKVIFEKDVSTPSSVKVYYTVYDNLNNKENAIRKNAEIKFLMSTINKDFINSGKKLNFLITDFDNKQEKIME